MAQENMIARPDAVIVQSFIGVIMAMVMPVRMVVTMRVSMRMQCVVVRHDRQFSALAG